MHVLSPTASAKLLVGPLFYYYMGLDVFIIV